jgi:low affinity Fe/Cu permease
MTTLANNKVATSMSVACNMISLPKSIPQGITALVIKAVVIAIAGPVKKSGLGYQVQILL